MSARQIHVGSKGNDPADMTLEEKYKLLVQTVQLLYQTVEDQTDEKIQGKRPNWGKACYQVSQECVYALSLCGEPLDMPPVPELKPEET